MDIKESELRADQLIELREYHEAERLLTSLADQGSVYALMVLAWIYQNGCLGSKNVRAAEYYYEQAILQGRTDAFLRLGRLLLNDGRESEARKVFRRGSERGHIGCAGELGWMLVNGVGGDIRKAEGRKLLEEASDHGHLLAQRRIITLELSGRPSFIKRIALFSKLLVILWKTFFEVYRDERSDKIASSSTGR